jgi:DNA-directed RNA polymerase specialized sigma24 family protein
MYRFFESLKSLPTEQREALLMRYVQGLPCREIAQLLGKTDEATRLLLTRALNKLTSLVHTRQVLVQPVAPTAILDQNGSHSVELRTFS